MRISRIYNFVIERARNILFSILDGCLHFTCDRYASVKRACCVVLGTKWLTNELKIVENSSKQRVKRATIVEASYWKYFRDISITIYRRLDKKKRRKKKMSLRVAKMIDLLKKKKKKNRKRFDRFVYNKSRVVIFRSD